MEVHLALFRLLHDPLLRGRRVVVATSAPAALRRERRRLGISRVIGLPATVEEIVTVLRAAVRTAVPNRGTRPRLTERSGAETVMSRSGAPDGVHPPDAVCASLACALRMTIDAATRALAALVAGTHETIGRGLTDATEYLADAHYYLVHLGDGETLMGPLGDCAPGPMLAAVCAEEVAAAMRKPRAAGPDGNRSSNRWRGPGDGHVKPAS